MTADRPAGPLAGVATREYDRRMRALPAALALLALFPFHAVAGPTLDGCPLFPADSIWNTAIDKAPVHASSDTFVATIGASTALHPDFGTVYNGAPNGIPYITVSGTQAPVAITFQYADESDPGPYPIPPDAPIEGGPGSNGDRHVIVVDRDACVLYEVWNSRPQPDGSWTGGSGAKWSLTSNALRPASWTSADAAGLPILPGLVRYDEVLSGAITHALRFTVPQTRNTYIWPARHKASSLTGTQYPQMGLRFRLKAGFDISGFTPRIQVILRALKKYGMIVADNGSAWYLSGAPDPRWSDDELHTLTQLVGSNFEAVDESGLQLTADSGQAKQPVPLSPPPPGANYDIDNDGHCDALTDGLLIIRWMFGIRGTALTGNALAPGAMRNASEVETYLGQLGAALDADGDGTADALTDGLLILRRLFGLSGTPLVAGATATGATRTTAEAIAAFIDGYAVPAP